MRGTTKVIAAAGLAMVMAMTAAAAATAERVGDMPAAPAALGGLYADPLIERVQEDLRARGFYFGPVDGRPSDETERAVRDYQRRTGLVVDGRVTEALARHLETSEQVDKLLSRMRTLRFEKMTAAREALMQRPETRRLLGGEAGARADPTRDPGPCFRTPTPVCLLDEAAESAKAVARDELRDWARGEILVAQAKAGLADAALETVAGIADPRLIIVALRDIARAQAESGRTATALAAARLIPTPLERVEALSAVAAVQVRLGDPARARRTVADLLADLARVAEPLEQVSYRVRAAMILETAGDAAAARTTLDDAVASARAAAGPADHRAAALRHVAAALADAGRVATALELLDDVTDDGERVPILVATASALARAGESSRAVAMAADIGVPRYRAVVLARIAGLLAEQGQVARARGVLETARTAADTVTMPYARAFAESRLALAWAAVGRAAGGDGFDRAQALADGLSVDKLRARTLWAVAAERRRAGDPVGAEATTALARTATDAVSGALSRVWILADVACRLHGAGHPDLARAVFDRGLAEAADMRSPWVRARALAKLATVLVGLLEPDAAAPPPVPPESDGGE